jgi:glycosyltransferase involved in cell wall biosynthesis
MRLVFLDNNLQYDGSILERQPLGGSETAFVHMARELAKRGHEVRVYNRCPLPKSHDGVDYRGFERYGETAYIRADATIALRNPMLLNGFTNSLVTVLWMQDAFNQPILKPLAEPKFKTLIDRLFFVSRWQKWSFLRCFDWPAERTFITRNGVHLDDYKERAPLDARGKRLFYSSTPYRGLHLLLQLFPRILKQAPDAELHVHSSMAVYQVPEAQDRRDHGEIYKLLQQPGVVSHGSVTQPELAKRLSGYRLMAYPNVFHETGCIAAVEAMAAGCPVVTSAQGALPEILYTGGALVTGVPGSGAYNEHFIDYCATFLQDDVLWERQSGLARERAFKCYGWDRIAQEWEFELATLVQERREKA